MAKNRKMIDNTAGTGDGRRRFGWKDYTLYYLGYTLLFCVMTAAVFVWFWLRKRRLVWKTDGVNQHYYGLLYFSRWGKEVLRNFRETGTLQIPTFTLRMGYGEDLYTTLAYYVIGDPFSLPAVFVPERYLLVFHDLMLLARFYLAGITFSAYCFVMGRKSRLGVLAGALIYLFNGFTMSGMRHHYFLNPFVFFPLLLIGCERVFRKKKPGLFVFMVFVTAVSNFYFFYMMVIMTVLYAVWRSLRLRGLRRFGQVILDGISFVWYGILGTLLSAFIFLPVVLRFLQDPRTTDNKQIPWHWTRSFYRNFIDCFLTNGTSALAESWTYMGFGAIALLCILYIFVRWRKHFDLKAAFVGLTCCLLTPAAGYVLNGFSYPANRWMWAYALLIGFMAATAVPELAEEAGIGHLAAVLGLTGVLIAVCVGWEYTFSRDSAQAVIIGLFGFAAVLLGHAAMRDREQNQEQNREYISAAKRKISLRVQAALLICVMLTGAGAAYFDFSPTRSAKVFEYLSRAQIETQTAKDAAAASELIDGQLLAEEQDESSSLSAAEPENASAQGNASGKDAAGGEKAGTAVPFYRYTAYNPENNTSLLYGVSNTQYYWSLSNASTSQFFSETGQYNRMIHLYDTLDDRTFLNEIAGIRYFLGTVEEGLPYGYEKKEGLSYSNEDLWPDNDGLERYSCEVFENIYALPLGFTSDRWISREEYDEMNIPQRQQALLQGILLENDPGKDFIHVSAAAGQDQAGDADGVQTAAVAGAEGNTTVTLSYTDVRVPLQIEYNPEEISATGLVPVSGQTAEGQNSGAGEAASVPGAEGFVQGAGEKMTFTVKNPGASLTIRFAGLPDCETGLYLRGFEYAPPEGKSGPTKMLLPVSGYEGSREITSKQIGLTTPMDPWTTGRKDFLINMLYHEEALDRIELTLAEGGTFSLDSIEVVCQPMETYPAMAQALRESVLTDLNIHEMGDSYATEKITGHIDLDEPRILCLQIPCVPGWTAYVDGVHTELLQADTMFSALLLPAGSHDIELRYQTPGFRLGVVISAATLLLILLFRIIYLIIFTLLRGGERRRAAIPAGEYTPVEMNTPAGMNTSAGMGVPEGMSAPEGMSVPEGMSAPEEMNAPEEMSAPEETSAPRGMNASAADTGTAGTGEKSAAEGISDEPPAVTQLQDAPAAVEEDPAETGEEGKEDG